MRKILEPGIRDARDIPRDLFEHIQPGQVGVWERSFCEPTEDGAGERTSGEDKVGHVACGLTVSEKDDAFLSEEGVEEEDDGVGVRAGGMELWMKGGCEGGR
jgi:hypothetical protein